MKEKIINGKPYIMDNMRKLVTIEKDHACHDDQALESWYAAAHLNRDTDRIGIQYHASTMTGEGLPPVLFYNINVINEKKEKYKSVELAVPLNEVAISHEKFDIEGKNFKFAGDEHELIYTYDSEDLKIDLKAVATLPVLKYLGEGYGNFLGAAQYGYSFPAMKTTGTVVIDDETYECDGITWFDRQWGDLPDYFANNLKDADDKAASAGRTTFYNPQLDNGVVMSLGEVYQDAEGIYTYNATISEPDGTIILVELDPPECSDYWESKVTGHKYPTKFKFRLPAVNAELDIEVPYKPQQIVSRLGGMTKYEGAAIVTGTYKGEAVKGDCYVELLGDWF